MTTGSSPTFQSVRRIKEKETTDFALALRSIAHSLGGIPITVPDMTPAQ
jgi:hypothetical protein